MNMPSAVYYEKVSQKKKKKKKKIKAPQHETHANQTATPLTMNLLLHLEPKLHRDPISMNTAHPQIFPQPSTQAATIHVCTNSARFLSHSSSPTRTHHLSSVSPLHHLGTTSSKAAIST